METACELNDKKTITEINILDYNPKGMREMGGPRKR